MIKRGMIQWSESQEGRNALDLLSCRRSHYYATRVSTTDALAVVPAGDVRRLSFVVDGNHRIRVNITELYD